VIGQKIENSLKLNSPKERLEIIIASDHSIDNTHKLVSEYTKKLPCLQMQALTQWKWI